MKHNQSPQSQAKLIPPGSVLSGRYVVDQVVLQRPLLTAYRAYDLTTTKFVVLEVLDETLIHDAVMLPRLKEEANRAKELVHDNIVPFHGFEQDGPLLFSLRDYVDGVTLMEYLAQLGRSPMFYEVMQVVDQTGSALHHAHRAGFIHRSINPKSIVLRQDGRVLVLGFGLPSLAGISNDTDVDPVYLSPEQCVGRSVDHRTDLYSLAVVAYAMCAGGPPFTGNVAGKKDISAWERICWQQMNEPPPFAPKLNSDLPKEIGWFLSKALAKRPAERFRSAAEFVILMKRAWKEAGLDPDAMCLEPPPWIREPETIVPPRAVKPSARSPDRPTRPSMPETRTPNQKIPILWLAGLFMVVAAVWVVLFTFILGNYGEERSGLAFSQGSDSTLSAPLFAVPTWTPPIIPTATGTRTIINASLLDISAPTVVVPSGIPFNGLRGLTNEFNWAEYAGSVRWRSYTDPRFGFALAYPDGWGMQPGMNVSRLYMSERDVGVVICSCGTRVADASQWAVRVLDLLRNDFPGIEQLEQRIYKPGWLATLARVPQDENDDIQLAILSSGQGERGYAVVFVAWASDWQGAKPIFDQMAKDMRFP